MKRLTELDLLYPSPWYDILIAARVQCVSLRIAEAAEQTANVHKVKLVVPGPVLVGESRNVGKRRLAMAC